jgi:hypothetical protein
MIMQHISTTAGTSSIFSGEEEIETPSLNSDNLGHSENGYSVLSRVKKRSGQS